MVLFPLKTDISYIAKYLDYSHNVLSASYYKDNKLKIITKAYKQA